MKKNSKSILNGKGFYIALALSVAMVGAACYFAYTQTANDIAGQLDSTLSKSDSREAAEVKTDVPKLTTAETIAEAIVKHTETAVTAVKETQPEEDEEAEETAKPEVRKLVMPIEGEVMNEFSNGDPVIASDSGTVSAIEEDPLWGVTVTIDHGNGIITRYCNLNSGVTVQAGQQISSGEEIGAVGETADIETSDESHLHFEVLKNGSYVDPLSMM